MQKCPHGIALPSTGNYTFSDVCMICRGVPPLETDAEVSPEETDDLDVSISRMERADNEDFLTSWRRTQRIHR